MYGHGHFTAFTGFAVAADASGLFSKLGLAGPVLGLLHVLVGVLLVVWSVAFVAALVSITAHRLSRRERLALSRTVLTSSDAGG